MRVAVIDLGSNSFRLFVADVDDSGALGEALVEKRMLRLGAQVGRHGHLTPPAIKRVLRAATELHVSASAVRADAIVVVATSAIRDAANRHEVVSTLTDRLGVPVRVLEGEEEATLSYVGARAGLPGDGSQRAILDLGGGSLELAWGHDAAPSFVATAAVGVARLAAEARVASTPTSKQLARVRSLVEERVAGAAGDHANAGAPVVFGGGSARAVARVLGATKSGGSSVHGVTIEASDVERLAGALLGTSLDERMRMPGVSQRRALDLPVAATVVAAALDVLGAAAATMSEWGLRHGVALDAVAARRSALT